MARLLLGLVKGAAIGIGLGLGARALGMTGGWGYLVYGVAGFLVGMLVGRPVWSHLVDKKSTVVTAVIKGLVGVGVSIGLFALGRAVADPTLAIAGESHSLTNWPPIFGGVVGALYGAFVELDDADDKKGRKKG